MESKIISIEEANRMLPLVKRIVRDIVHNWEQIILRRAELECLEKGLDRSKKSAAAEGDIHELKQELNYLIDKINSYIKELESLGCFVEEFKRGVVNFPSLYHGRKVFLCWKPGEEDVRHWHELDESAADRVRIRDVRDFLYRKPGSASGASTSSHKSFPSLDENAPR